MLRLVQGAVLLVAMAGLGTQSAFAQASPPTPLTGIPTVPRTLSVTGGGGFPAADNSVVVASATNRLDYVNLLISSGNSPDDVDKEGRTGLMYAAMSNYADIARVLVDHAAKLDIRDKLGFTALHWAAERGSVEIMRLLLAARAFVDAQNTQGITPLMLASSSGNAGAVRLLLQNSADPLKQDYTGNDAFGWAGNHTAIVDLLKHATAH
jgi:ankyrin repeat protein